MIERTLSRVKTRQAHKEQDKLIKNKTKDNQPMDIHTSHRGIIQRALALTSEKHR